MLQALGISNRVAVDVHQEVAGAAPGEELELAPNDAELVQKVLAEGLRSSASDSRPVHNAYWRTDSGKSEVRDKCVLLHETCAMLFPPAGSAGDEEDALPAEPVGEWRVVLFHDGAVEAIPAGWATLETAEEAADEAAMATVRVEHGLLIGAVQDGGVRAMRQSGLPIHTSPCRDGDGEKGATVEKCVVLSDVAAGLRKIVLFAFGSVQALPAEWVSDKPAEAAGKLNEDALRIYALHAQHAATEAEHGKRKRAQSSARKAEASRAAHCDLDRDLEKIREESHIARSSLWTVRLEEVPKDHLDQFRARLARREPVERWGVAGPPGLIKASATVLLPAALGIVPFIISLSGAKRGCAVGADKVLVPCAEINPEAFIFYTCAIWLVGCALCLLEFYRTQLRPLGFGSLLHYAYIFGSAVGTFCLLEFIFYEKVPPGLLPQLSFHMGCLIGSIWGYMSLAVFLVLRHRKSSLAFVQRMEQESARAAAQADADKADRSRLTAQLLRRVVSKRAKIPPTADSPEKQAGQTQPPPPADTTAAVRRVQIMKHASRKWRDRAHLGASNRKHVLKGFVFWVVGISLLVLNWVWLQIFVLGYMKLATSPERISFGLSVFNFSQMVASYVVTGVMQRAEMQRVGADHANFDRFVLTNQISWAFTCYSAIFKASLVVGLSDWTDFWAYWLTDAVTSMVAFVVPMSRNLHALLGTDLACCRWPLCQRMLGKVVDNDLLHQRGNLCFGEFLGRWADLVGCAQYVLFVGYIVTFGEENQVRKRSFLRRFRRKPEHLPRQARDKHRNNSKKKNVFFSQSIFIPFSTAAGFDFQLQLQFCAVACILDFLQYVVTNIVAERVWQLSPMYVGACHLRQYPEFRRSMVLISMHIVSDVYLGMVFAMSAGIYFTDD